MNDFLLSNAYKPLASLSTDWLNALSAFHRLVVGFSGGLDSTVLLHYLHQHSEIASKLIALHVNHHISPHADAWESHCRDHCSAYSIPLETHTIQATATANREAVARRLRYQCFDQCLTPQDALVLAHHADDQAETLLLQLGRGAGLLGLGGMRAERKHHHYTLCRPLLTYTKADLHHYAKQHHLSWIEDESNHDASLARNYLRHHVIPLLKAKWPEFSRQSTKAAFYCQQAYDQLSRDASTKSLMLALAPLRDLPPSQRSYPVWSWLHKHQVTPLTQRIVQQVLHALVLAPHAAGLHFPFAHHDLWCHGESLHLVPKPAPLPNAFAEAWTHFPDRYQLPHHLGYLTPRPHAAGGLRLAPSQTLTVRFRTGGETLYWHKQTKSLKKLMQAWQVPTWQRTQVPLLYVADELVAVVGYAIHDHYFHPQGLAIDWEPCATAGEPKIL